MVEEAKIAEASETECPGRNRRPAKWDKINDQWFFWKAVCTATHWQDGGPIGIVGTPRKLEKTKRLGMLVLPSKRQILFVGTR